MYSNTGIVEGFYCGQQDRVDELNTRIQSRFVPDNALRPNYDPRPVSTKYALFPTIDRKTPSKEYLKPSTEYLGEATFGLGEATFGLGEATFGLGEATFGFGEASTTSFSPLITNSPFIRNVDTETILRNQTVALQNGIGQSVYVPSSTSDLYNNNTSVVSRPSEQPFPDLFVKPTFSTNIPPIANQNIGKSDFFNYTRTQLRNSL